LFDTTGVDITALLVGRTPETDVQEVR